MKKKISIALLALVLSVNGCGMTEIKNSSKEAEGAVESEETKESSKEKAKEALEENVAETSEEKIEKTKEVKNHAELETKLKVTYESGVEEVKSSNGAVVFEYRWKRPKITMEGNEQVVVAIEKEWQEKIAETKKQVENLSDTAMELYEKSSGTQGSIASVGCEMISNKNGIITLDRQIGGMNAGEFISSKDEGYMNYDIATGELLSLKDVLEEETEGKKQMTEALVTQIQMMKLEEYEKSELVQNVDSIMETKYWYLSKVGIHFITSVLHNVGGDTVEIIIPFDTITSLKEKYKPQTKAWAVADGGSIRMDLDGDGVEEELAYGKMEEETGDPKLVINGVDFGKSLYDLGACFAYGTRDFCYLVDLDERDSYVEIVVGDHGVGETMDTNFFRYDKGSLVHLGKIHDAFGAYTCTLLGEGKLLARAVADVFEDGRIEHEYHLSEKQLLTVEKEWYEMDMSEYLGVKHQECNILKDVTVYTQDNVDSATKVLTPLDGPVIFTMTDNKKWVQLQTKDGTVYYIHIIDYCTMQNGNMQESPSEVFDNLLLV